jgi:IS30 family transposase
MTQEQKRMAAHLAAKGFSLKTIARDLGFSSNAIVLSLRGDHERHRPGEEWEPGPRRLSAGEREQIFLGLARGESMSAIARRLGRAPSTVTREVAANGGRAGYGPWKARCRARAAARRPKSAKLSHLPLVVLVGAWLEEWWSPQEIAERLRLEFPDDPMMQVSHETIYQSLFVQGRGELRRELTRCLRSGRTQRRPQGSTTSVGMIPDMVMISERPAQVEDRAVPGHWEGDLIMGANNRSAVGTLVERSTRFVLLMHLGEGKTAKDVEEAMKKAVATLPAELVRSVTWDQGKEMANHSSFTMVTGIPVYFCDPHSPWQRGSNENTNGLLRQYMPKGTDLSKHRPEDLARFQRSLNNRPRKTLGYMKPWERLADLVAQIP